MLRLRVRALIVMRLRRWRVGPMTAGWRRADMRMDGWDLEVTMSRSERGDRGDAMSAMLFHHWFWICVALLLCYRDKNVQVKQQKKAASHNIDQTGHSRSPSMLGNLAHMPSRRACLIWQIVLEKRLTRKSTRSMCSIHTTILSQTRCKHAKLQSRDPVTPMDE
jgi:hypothetical protein